jgi:prophage regulatory protein
MDIDPIMRFPEVEAATGKPRPSIYADMRRGTFPKPQKIGARAVGWRTSVIKAWLDERQRATEVATSLKKKKKTDAAADRAPAHDAIASAA